MCFLHSSVFTALLYLEYLKQSHELLMKALCFHFCCCLMQGMSSSASVMQAVLGLLLPLAYEFNPGLLLEVLGCSAGVEVPVWAQVTSLLQGIAQGRTLALLQVSPCCADHVIGKFAHTDQI